MSNTKLGPRFPRKDAIHLGEVIVSIRVENLADILTKADSPRAAEMPALIDTGATALALPRDVVNQLGLEITGTMPISYADEREDEVEIASAVRLHLAGKQLTTDVLVLPAGAEALVGHIILEWMNIIVDPPRQRVIPVQGKTQFAEPQ